MSAADPRAQRAQGRRGLPPRLLARARRPRPHGLDDEERRRRSSAASRRRAPSARPSSTALQSTPSSPLSSPEAAELTKLLENIFRAVNIALVNELAQLCERMEHRRLGGRRGRRDEAVRLHALQAGPGPRRPLHPDRPVLPHVEGARVRLLHRVHRARRQGQREHAVLLPLAHLAGAEPRRAEVAQGLAHPRPRRRVQGGHRRRARVAGGKDRRAAAERPARTSRTTTRTSPSSTACARSTTHRRATTAS